MKKTTTTFALYSMFFLATSFVVQAQDMARVTVTINSLTYVPTDSYDGTMDFYAKIFIGDKIKKFPVRTGNQLRDLNWQFTTTTISSTANIRIEVWDYDAFFTGGDDRVCVDGKSRGIAKTISTMEVYNLDFHSRKSCNESGIEWASISYNITIEPTRTAYLIQGIWKEVKHEIRTGSGEWEEARVSVISGIPGCKADDYRIFRKNATYVLYEGPVKCNPLEPASKTGTWSFQNNDSKLQLNIPGSSFAIIYNVNWIDKTKMILSTSSTSGGVTFYERYTYSH